MNEYNFCSADEALKILGLDSKETLRNWRRNAFQEGIHFRQFPGTKAIKYNERLLLSYAHHDAEEHQVAISNYLRWRDDLKKTPSGKKVAAAREA